MMEVTVRGIIKCGVDKKENIRPRLVFIKYKESTHPHVHTLTHTYTREREREETVVSQLIISSKWFFCLKVCQASVEISTLRLIVYVQF